MEPDHDLINKSNNTEVDLEAYPTAKELVTRCQQFFAEIEDLTPGKALEEKLNANYGPGNSYYEDFCRLIRAGLSEGWVANIEIDGPRYRRSKISQPNASTRYFSITTVYMDSTDSPQQSQGQNTGPENEEGEEYAGNYHVHPYGEINCVVQIDEGAQLMGMQGWQGKGWTSPGPGTHHFPLVRRGAVVALFFLPAGRIAYNVKPGQPQPLSV